MPKQIEIFSPYDPIVQDLIQNSKVEYSVKYVDVTDNETKKTFRVYVNKTEEKKLVNNPEKYMEEYFKKNSCLDRKAS